MLTGKVVRTSNYVCGPILKVINSGFFRLIKAYHRIQQMHNELLITLYVDISSVCLFNYFTLPNIESFLLSTYFMNMPTPVKRRGQINSQVFVFIYSFYHFIVKDNWWRIIQCFPRKNYIF